MSFEELFKKNTIIGAIASDEDLELILKSDLKIVFILYGSVMNIKLICDKLRAHNKCFFVHIDMIDGLKSDVFGVHFIKKEANPHGIITTKSSNIKFAHKFRMYTILRIFEIDSRSLVTGKKNVMEHNPNAVEVMPGVSEKIIKMMKKLSNKPLIASGLLDNREEIAPLIEAGAVAISTTNKGLWV